MKLYELSALEETQVEVDQATSMNYLDFSRNDIWPTNLQVSARNWRIIIAVQSILLDIGTLRTVWATHCKCTKCIASTGPAHQQVSEYKIHQNTLDVLSSLVEEQRTYHLLFSLVSLLMMAAYFRSSGKSRRSADFFVFFLFAPMICWPPTGRWMDP